MSKVNGTISQIDEEGWQENESRKVVFNRSNKSLDIFAPLAQLKGSQISFNGSFEFAKLNVT